MLSSADRVAARPLVCGTSTTPARAAASLSSSSAPSTLTVPDTAATAGRMARASAHSRDDLPAPEGPVTDTIRPATLRGLAPDQTLVLVNSTRRHTSALVNVNGSVGRGSAAVDLNAIPAAAIERVEILREGASAQYGSDAIAGVINIVLKTGPRREALASLGQTTQGDGTVAQLSTTLGREIGEAGYVTLSAEFRDRENTNRSLPDTRQQ